MFKPNFKIIDLKTPFTKVQTKKQDVDVDVQRLCGKCGWPFTKAHMCQRPPNNDDFMMA